MTEALLAVPHAVHRRRAELAAGAMCAVGGLIYLYVADPHDPHTPMPMCPTKLITGLDCPACGGLRLVHDLLHRNAGAAARDNLFLLLISPLLLVLLGRAAGAIWRGRPAQLTPRIAYPIAIAAVGWMVLRNLPGWPLRTS